MVEPGQAGNARGRRRALVAGRGGLGQLDLAGRVVLGRYIAQSIVDEIRAPAA